MKFVAVTNGDAGHQTEGGGALARRRRAEAQEAARRFGIVDYDTLDNHDGPLVPSVDVREQVSGPIHSVPTWRWRSTTCSTRRSTRSMPIPRRCTRKS